MNIGGSYTWRPRHKEGEKKRRIPWPKEPSEFEIHAFLYTKLKSLGYVVRGEVRAKKVRFDLVVYAHLPRNENPVEIIEVKKHAKKTEKGRLEKQIKKYREFGLTITVIHGMKQAEGFIRQKKQKLKEKV